MRRIALVLLAIALSATPARAGSPADDLAWLNAKRAASGIPAGITENPALSAACALHVAYMRKTNTVTHEEDPASPYFTEAGNWAGTHAVLASAATWTEGNFIWETAPLHLAQLLAPQLSQVGIADDGQYVCITTWPGYLRPPPPVDAIVAYPGPGVLIYAAEFTTEWPVTAAAALGLANPTGPHIYVYRWGTGSSGWPIGIERAFLRGPNGEVPVRIVDTRNPIVGRYLPDASGIVVPVSPLARGTRYAVSVQLTDGTSAAWTFDTADGNGIAPFRDVRFGFSRVALRPACVAPTNAGCADVQLRRFTTLEIRGRVKRASAGDGGIEVFIDGVAQAVGRHRADGAFVLRYPIRARAHRRRLRVALRHGRSAAAYVVRIRPGTGPTAATAMGYVDAGVPIEANPPVRNARPRTGPDPRGTGPCSRCS